MHRTVITKLPATLTAVLGTLVLAGWLSYDPIEHLQKQLPEMSGEPLTLTPAPLEAVTIGAHFTRFAAEPPTGLNQSWPRFRGADFSNISASDVNIDWPDGQAPILWTLEVGEGHAGAAVHKGRVFLMDYDEAGENDMLRCFSLENGQELWRRWYHLRVRRNHGMSRTVPAVTDQYVVTLGPKCHVMCVDTESGALLWGLDLVKQYGTEVPMWYAGQCPLIDDNVAVLAPAGTDVLMTGIDCETGEVLWETPNTLGYRMSHSSIIPGVVAGKYTYVYSAIGGVVGVSAEPQDRGKLLWSSSAWNRNVIAPSPVILADGRIFLTAGYGGGSMMLQVSKNGAEFAVELLQELKPNEGLASEQHTPIFYDGHLFAVLPKDAGALRNQLVCVNPEDCSTFVWNSGKTNRFGLGPYLIAGDKMLILTDDGTLTALRASIHGYEELAQVKIMDGHDAWAPMALADGRLLLRDDTRLVCVDVRKPAAVSRR